MTYFTMVSRCGAPKTPANLMNYTLVDNNFGIRTMSGNQLAKALNESKINVTNMAVSAKGLVSTNGALDKYTTFDASGMLTGPARCVILNRKETSGKLSGYVIYDLSGMIREASVAEAVSFAQQGLIANGKVRHTMDGDIVSSINGVYPLIEIKITDTKDARTTVNATYFGSAIKNKKLIKFAGITVTSKSAKTINNLYGTLSDNNAKLCSKLEASYGYKAAELKSFGIRPTPGGGFYGVYTLDCVTKLMGNSDVKCPGNKLIIACLDKDEEDVAESIAIVALKTKSIATSQAGTTASDAKLKDYVASVLEKF